MKAAESAPTAPVRAAGRLPVRMAGFGITPAPPTRPLPGNRPAKGKSWRQAAERCSTRGHGIAPEFEVGGIDDKKTPSQLCEGVLFDIAPKQPAKILERLDLDFAEFHDALVVRHAVRILDAKTVLKGDMSVGQLRVLRAVDRLLPVENDGEGRALRRNVIGIPLAGRVRHRIDLGDIDDGAGAVARIRPRVPDIDLVAIVGADLVGVGAANEYAAVGIRFDPELGLDLVILVLVLGDEEAVALVSDDHAVLDPPIGVAGLGKAVEILAVEQRDPATFARCRRRPGHRSQTERKQGNHRSAFHRKYSPLMLFLVLARSSHFSIARTIAGEKSAGKPAAADASDVAWPIRSIGCEELV